MSTGPAWVLGPGAVQAGRDINGPVTVTVVTGTFDRLTDAIFDPEPLREVLDLDHFTGRSWITEQVDQFIATHSRGYVMIQAEAGVGKSALAAHLAFTRPCAYHFTRIEGARSPEQARRGLAAQLIGQWQLHQLAPGDVFPTIAGRPDWLLKVIRAAAAKRDSLHRTNAIQETPLVVVVDGLDEADPPAIGQDTGIPLGLPRPEHLPSGVFFVVTSRFGISLSAVRGPVDWRTIQVDGTDNLADIRTYLHNVVAGDYPDRLLLSRLVECHADPQHFIEEMASRCGGVWMYLRYVLDDIRAARRRPTRLDGLPDDLTGYYLEQVQEWSSDTEVWHTVALPLFATIAALRRPASRVELARLAEVAPHAAEGWLEGRLRPFLERNNDGRQLLYSIRHQSLRDLFQRPSRIEPHDSGVRETLDNALREAHRRISLALIPPGTSDDRDWTSVDSYARTALPEHAAACGLLDDLVCEPGFLLACDPPALLRRRSPTLATQALAAFAAYELCVDHWDHLESDADRLWWLHVWARKTHCTQLAERAATQADFAWTVASAMWTGFSHRTLVGHTAAVVAVCAVPLPDGQTLLASASNDGTVRLWDPVTGVQVGDPLNGHTAAVRAVCAVPLPDGRTLLASASDDYTVRLWDPVIGVQVGDPLIGHTHWVWAVCPVPLSDRRTLLASASSDATVRLWDPMTGKPIGKPIGKPKANPEPERLPQVQEWEMAICAMPLQDGRTLLVSGRNDGTVRLWDPVTGVQVGDPLIGHAAAVRAVCAVPLPDGRTLLASASDDATVQLVEPATGTEPDDLTIRHTKSVVAVCAAPLSDGRTLLTSASDDATVRLWDPATSLPVGDPLIGHTNSVRSVCALPLQDGRTLLASASNDRTVRLWNPMATAPADRTINGHTGWVAAVCGVPSSDGRTLLASASDDATVRLWDPATSLPVGDPLIGHTNSVRSVCALPLQDGRTLLASASNDRTVRLWNPEAPEPARLLAGHRAPVRAVCAVPLSDGRTLVASASDDKTVRLWDPLAGELTCDPLVGHTSWVVAVCAVPLPDGRTWVASASFDGTVRLWDPVSGAPVSRPLIGHTQSVLTVCAVPLPEGRVVLASAGTDATVRLWDPVAAVQVCGPLISHASTVRAVCFVPLSDEQSLLASAGDDKTIRFWDPVEGEPVGDPLTGHTDPVLAMCALPLPSGRTLLASTSSDRATLIWRRHRTD